MDVATACEATLRDVYKNVLSHVRPLPWCEKSLPLDDIYTDLELETNKGSVPIKTDELFSANFDCHNPRRVLIEGDPGYGKSTFCLKLAYDWARGKLEFLRNCKLLFVLSLHQFRGTFIDTIFETLLPENCPISRERLLEFIHRNQEKVVFILDGWDELVGTTGDEITKLLEGRILRHCGVILTSRKVRDIQDNQQTKPQSLLKRRTHFDRLLNLRGFSRDSLKEFVRKHFLATEERADSADEIIQQIEMSVDNNTIMALVACPMNALLMCDVWKEFGSILLRTTPLYEKILQLIVKRYCEKSGQNRQITKEDIEKQFAFLGKLAVDVFLDEKKKFDKSELRLEENKDVLKMGFLTRYSNNRILSQDPSASFIIHHKTFQEFFAAKYLALLSKKDPEKMRTILHRFSTTSKFKKSDFHSEKNLPMYRFLAGLLNDTADMMFSCMYFNNLTFLVECLMETDITENLIASAVSGVNCKLNLHISLDADQKKMIDVCERALDVLPCKQSCLVLSLIVSQGSYLAAFKSLLQHVSSMNLLMLDLCVKFRKSVGVDSPEVTKRSRSQTTHKGDKSVNISGSSEIHPHIHKNSETVITSTDVDAIFSIIDDCHINNSESFTQLHIVGFSAEESAIQNYFGNRKRLKSVQITSITVTDQSNDEGVSSRNILQALLNDRLLSEVERGQTFDFFLIEGNVNLSVDEDSDRHSFKFSKSDIMPYRDSLVQFIKASGAAVDLFCDHCNLTRSQYVEMTKDIKNSKIKSLHLAYPIDEEVLEDDHVTLPQFEEFVDAICNLPHLYRLSITAWKFTQKHTNLKTWEDNWKKLFTKLQRVQLSYCLPSDRSTLDIEPHPMITGLCRARADVNQLRRVSLTGNTLNEGEVVELDNAALLHDREFSIDLCYCRVSGRSGQILKAHEDIIDIKIDNE